jgi:hypothetical protein
MSDTPPELKNIAQHLGHNAITRSECGHFGLRIGRDGTWYYLESPIRRPALVKLFASVLRYEGGEYWLVTPAERGKITVNDAPFLAVALEASGEGQARRLAFMTNLDEVVTADATHHIVMKSGENGDQRPYIEVRDGLMALIARPVFYELVELGESRSDGKQEQFGVWSAGHFFPLS